MSFLIGSKSTVLSNVIGALGSPTFLCILCSRLFYNIKEAADMGVNEGTNYRALTLSMPQFASPVIADAGK